MQDEEYWHNIEEQINLARSQMISHQQQRIFFIELLIAVIGVGFFINLLTSFVYDAWIKQEPVQYSSAYVFGLIVILGLSFYFLKRFRTQYSPIKPRIQFDIEILGNPVFDKLWPKTMEIIAKHKEDKIQRDPSPVIQDLWDSIKNSIYERPPYNSYLILKRELYTSYYVDFRFETEYLDQKYVLNILFHRSSTLKNHEPMALVTITILEPHKPYADDVWDQYAILTLMMDVSYVLEVGIENFNKKHKK